MKTFITCMAGVSDSREMLCTWPIPKIFGGRTGTVVSIIYANGAFGNIRAARPNDFVDGLSKTLFVGEVLGKGESTFKGHYWAARNLLDTADGINGPNTVIGGKYPEDAAPFYGWRGTGFASFHPQGCHFLFGDGSVSFLSETISQATLAQLTTRAGGEVTGDF